MFLCWPDKPQPEYEMPVRIVAVRGRAIEAGAV